MNEQALVFGCAGEQLLAVLTPAAADTPATAAMADVGVVIIVGGPQYRAGSHRQFVQLARSLARQGVSALRFDTRGMGDSSGAQRSLEEIEADVGAAIDALQTLQPGVKRVVLWGLCGGASAALLYWRHTSDPRLQGMVLVNPWVRSEETLARTQLKHYYLKRLAQRAFWAKLFSGGVAGKAVADLMHNLRLARKAKPHHSAPAENAHAKAGVDARQRLADDAARPLQQRMGLAWQHYPGPKLLVLSGNDYTAKEFIETAATDSLWRANVANACVSRFDVTDADHTFSEPTDQRAVEQRTLAWLLQSLGAGAGAGADADAPVAAHTSPSPAVPQKAMGVF